MRFWRTKSITVFYLTCLTSYKWIKLGLEEEKILLTNSGVMWCVDNFFFSSLPTLRWLKMVTKLFKILSNLLIVIIWLMLLVWVWVNTLSSFHCRTVTSKRMFSLKYLSEVHLHFEKLLQKFYTVIWKGRLCDYLFVSLILSLISFLA